MNDIPISLDKIREQERWKRKRLKRETEREKKVEYGNSEYM